MFLRVVLGNFIFQPNCKVTAMKCFLLELHVIWQESNNMDIREVIENLIILANSSLSSSGVSYGRCFWLDWGKS